MTLRVGVAGAGNIATNRHLPAFDSVDGVRLAAIYDTDASAAATTADEYGITAVDTFEDLCESADLVSLCTPPTVHCEQAVTALEAGCHVLTEKPMAMSIEEADRMIEAADSAERVLSVVHNFLYMDSLARARELHRDGDLGDVRRSYSIMLERSTAPKEYLSEAGGAGMRFWDEAPHVMYLSRAFLGDMALEDASVEHTADGDGYRSIRATYDGEDGARGHLVFLADSPITEWWHVVIGTEAIVCVDIFRDLVLRFDREESHSATHVISLLLSAIRQLTSGGLTAGLRYARERLAGYGIPEAGFATQVQQLVKAIETGGEPPVSGREGREILRDMETIRERTGMELD